MHQKSSSSSDKRSVPWNTRMLDRCSPPIKLSAQYDYVGHPSTIALYRRGSMYPSEPWAFRRTGDARIKVCWACYRSPHFDRQRAAQRNGYIVHGSARSASLIVDDSTSLVDKVRE